MIRALVFGGAFNPPTKAHIQLAEYAMKATGCEKVIFVPSKSRYIAGDQGKDYAFPEDDRLRMLNTIAENRDWMVVSDYELTLPEQPRTYLTLCHLREEGYAGSLLFGSDKLPELNGGWRYIDEICHEFGIVCMTRSGDNCEQMIAEDPYLSSIAPYITIVHTPDTYQHVSSTKVREAFAAMQRAREELKQYLPEELNCLSDYLTEE